METNNKAWLWRKKSSDNKSVNAANDANLSSKVTEEEVHSLLTDKAEMEKDLKSLNDKLSSALAKCAAKDELVKKHANMAQEAFAGWEKAEAVAVSLKQELDVTLQMQVASEERLMHLEAALKECMQQLRFVREEQEKRIHDAVMKTSREFERTKMVLEEELAETNIRLGRLGFENTHLSKVLLVKEKLIEDLNEQKTRAEVEYNALMARLDVTEKDNASLTYEVRVLEKELEIRNEEREFNQRTGDASHKQHLDGVKKIAKLESECQRLRLLIRKRLPGPAALAKMKNEVEMLGRDSAEIRRKNLNTSPVGLMVDLTVDSSPDTPTTRINLLTEQLCAAEEENKTLKEDLNSKINELQVSRIMYARPASKLSLVESRFEESSRGQTIKDITRSGLVSREFSMASMSDIGSDDKVSCSDSCASALISELEHFKNGKEKGTVWSKLAGVSDMSLMDDFVEIEKLAIFSADKSYRSSQLSSDEVNTTGGPLETKFSGSFSEALGKERVPEIDGQSNISVSSHEIQSIDIIIPKVPGWLQDIMKVILEQNRVTARKPNEILEDIRAAMAFINNSNTTEFADVESSNHLDASNHCHGKGCISWTNNSPVMDSCDRVSGFNIPSSEKRNPQFHWGLSESISKIIELIERISLPSSDHDTPEAFSGKDGSFLTSKNSETPTGYMVRVFQWKTSELSSVLRHFIDSCNDLMNGKANLEKFALELTSALDWIMNHCFSLQDVSSMRDSIKKHYGWDDTRSEAEAEMGMTGQFSEGDKVCVHNVQLPSFSAWNSHNYFSQAEEAQFNLREENRKLKDELIVFESVKKDLEGMLHSAIHQSDSLKNQLQESEKTIASLQTELETLKESKRFIEDQAKDYMFMNEDLDTQLTVARVELNEPLQRFASVEIELENRNHCCEELEATCLDLQLQVESVMKKENTSHDMEREEKQLQSDWEITTASEKLVECQETILNLGKQLKALASPREASLFDKIISTPCDTTTNPTATNTPVTPKKNMNQQRSSLLDRMLAEDDVEAIDLKSPKTKEMICSSNLQKPPAILDGNRHSGFGSNAVARSPERFVGSNGNKHHEDGAAVGTPASMLAKKRGGGGLWRKLLWRKKKGNNKNRSSPPLSCRADMN